MPREWTLLVCPSCGEALVDSPAEEFEWKCNGEPDSPHKLTQLEIVRVREIIEPAPASAEQRIAAAHRAIARNAPHEPPAPEAQHLGLVELDDRS